MFLIKIMKLPSVAGPCPFPGELGALSPCFLAGQDTGASPLPPHLAWWEAGSSTGPRAARARVPPAPAHRCPREGVTAAGHQEAPQGRVCAGSLLAHLPLGPGSPRPRSVAREPPRRGRPRCGWAWPRLKTPPAQAPTPEGHTKGPQLLDDTFPPTPRRCC